MKRITLFAIAIVALLSCRKDPVAETPQPVDPPVTQVEQTGLATTSIHFPGADSTFTISFDPAKGNAALAGFSGDVYAHIGAITNLSSGLTDWKYTKAAWDVNDPAAKMVRQSNGKYILTIKPRSFLNVPAGETILKLAMVFRNANGSIVGRNNDGSDIFIPLYNNSSLNVRLVEPEMHPTFDPKPALALTTVGQEITVTGVASQKANLSLMLNGTPFATAANSTQVTGKAKITAGGLQTIKVIANNTVENTISFLTGGAAVIEALPAGAKPGVTFINSGTSAIFALYAPGKQFVNVIGDFNNWTADRFMKKTPDGNTWWIQIDQLNPNTEYAYQYLVDGVLKIADPYSEKVLDPDNDPYIKSSANNWDFGNYPSGKTTGIVSMMKANTPVYNWRYTAFTRPAKSDLAIYELHLRDFLAANNFKTLTDTINYLARLGVNAVELMPVNEFEGNSSWGYNPSFYFAPDKFYGSKADLQRFIDECHGKGIAVILDMVLNHSFGQNPMVQLYFDGTKPVNSPWFNATPTHPFNVGYDFNHESPHTRQFVKDVIRFWMQEYKVDGFRFDLSKGFTQTNSGSNVDAWSKKDDSRINIWKDYNNYIKQIDANNFYVILEHFADDDEEQILALEGMMLWNNLNYSFNEASMGWLKDNNNNYGQSDFKRGIYTQHGFSSADYLVSYMESHDEERMMFKNISYGNASGSYNIKDLATALKRQEMSAAFLFAMPGPKMLWQFGELGYEISIDQNGRTGEKPLLWQYNAQPARVALRNAFAKFINLKKKNPVYRTTNLTYDFLGAVKYIKLTQGATTVVVVGNFDVISQQANINFGTGGNWYKVMENNQEMNLTGTAYTKTLQPGEYHIYSTTILAE